MKLLQSLIVFLFFSLAALAAPSEKCIQSPDPGKLAKDPRFQAFAYDFIEKFKLYGQFYKFPEMKNREEFVATLEECDNEESTVSEIYSNFSIDYEAAMEMKNAADNSLLQVFIDFPELQELAEDVAWGTISKGIDIVLENPETEYEVQRAIAPGEQITPRDVWECFKKALGVGAGSILSIGALQQMAKEGMEKLILQLTKLLAKRAGYFGAIVMIIEFTLCLSDVEENINPRLN